MWAGASRADLVLLRTAINKGWAVPVERRAPILEEIAPLLHNANVRLGLAVARVCLAAEASNLNTFSEALRLQQTNRPLAAPR